MAKDGFRFVEKTAFVMPLVPAELGVRPMTLAMLHAMAFLELSGDDTVDPDWAVEAMEHMVYYLRGLEDLAVQELMHELSALESWAKGSGFSELAEFFARFGENTGVGDHAE